jgi:hypothetical protein
MSKSLYDEITVRIRPLDGTIRVEEHTGNIVAVKNVSPDSLIACLEKGIKVSKTIKSGFLPANCVSYDVDDYQRTFTIWIPPGYIDLTYYKTVYEHFPLPAMAFSFALTSSGSTHSRRLTVIADEMPSPKTKTYKYPFSNVFGDGRICTGAANSMPVYKEARTLGTLPYHILRLPNNDDEYSRNNNKQKLLYRDLLEHLKDKDPSYYYEHILIPNGAVLQDFIDNRIIRGGARYAA